MVANVSKSGDKVVANPYLTDGCYLEKVAALVIYPHSQRFRVQVAADAH